MYFNNPENYYHAIFFLHLGIFTQIYCVLWEATKVDFITVLLPWNVYYSITHTVSKGVMYAHSSQYDIFHAQQQYNIVMKMKSQGATSIVLISWLLGGNLF